MVTPTMAGSVLAAAALLAAFTSVEGIKCYSCNSRHEPQCAEEKPPSDYLKECPVRLHHQGEKPYVLCRKIVQNIEYEVNGLKPDMRIIRSCGWDNSSFADRCYQRSGFGGRQEVCSCMTNECNSAASLTLPLGLIAVFILLQKLLR